ncbi:MAG: 3-hydroxyacyl-CoA dehydrogenase family protein [Cyclobacteriaceae bacterium]
MNNIGSTNEPILVIGSSSLTFSLVICLLRAGHPVTLYTREEAVAMKKIKTHWDDLYGHPSSNISNQPDFKIITQLSVPLDEKLVITLTREDLAEKKDILREIEKWLPLDAIITINTESIPLHTLQQEAQHKERILGANWVEPVHTTYFLEIITNEHTSEACTKEFYVRAKEDWQKDPYVLTNGLGIRSRMMCAMLREAFYLIKEGYVTPQDIDRACRNDPGYYFPFAGNFRYMDLMGSYIYGMVMQDLNPDLSQDREVPDFFDEMIEKGHAGMKHGQGFFTYEEGEVERWQSLFQKFSYQIQEIIEKYPFKYLEEEPVSKTRKTTGI